MTILVTGGAGFIGCNFILDWLAQSDEAVINLDKLTYAANLQNLQSLQTDERYVFVHADMADSALVCDCLNKYKVRAIINFAAESHVDRSIYAPANFIQTNVLGTFHLLEAVLLYFSTLDTIAKKEFRFLHVSTDEVYGSLRQDEAPFTENNRYQPNSPYSASKAASDHLVRSWYHTYGLPVLTTNCSNNYGEYQLAEKFIPLLILNAISGKPLPIYGDGRQIRDWLYVKDHCCAIRCVLNFGRIGETYNIGGGNEKSNLEVVEIICRILDELKPKGANRHYSEQISHVKDRLGHDRRYSIDASKIQQQLGWKPSETFANGIYKTIVWYLNNQQNYTNLIPAKYSQPSAVGI